MKRKIKSTNFLIASLASVLFMVLFFACIDRIELEVESEAPVIVIEGLFSNLLETQVIHVYQSIEVNSQINKVVFGAEIFVEDQDGNQIPFAEQADGSYTAFAKAEEGKQYRLFGILNDGVEISSNLQRVPESIPLEEINVVDTLVTFLNDNGNTRRLRALDFYADVSIDPVSAPKYCRFSPNTVFQISERTCTPGVTPDTCYFYNDNRPSEVNLFTLEETGDRVEFSKLVYRRQIDYSLVEIFSLDLDLYSYNKEEYEYWIILKSLFDQKGGIADRTPGRLKGNVTASDGSEIQGQFAVVGKTRKIRFINDTDYSTFRLPFCGVEGTPEYLLPPTCCACATLPKASLDKPDYWP